MVRDEEVEVVVAHHEHATLRVGDAYQKIDADHTRTDVQVAYWPSIFQTDAASGATAQLQELSPLPRT